MERCNNCQRNYDTSALTEAIREDETTGRYCSGCLSTLFFSSSHNMMYYPRSQRVRNDSGEWVTQQQLEAPGWGCQHCESHMTESDTSWYVYNENNEEIIVCTSCYEYHYTACSECNREQLCEGFRDVDYNGMTQACQHCCNETESFNNWCGCCDNRCHSDQWVERIGEYRCPSCPEPESTILSWSHRPDFDLQKRNFEDPAYEPYLGVELEVGTDYPENVANQICQDMGDNIYFKHDSSCDGFEIISHPMTLEFHKKHEGWRDKLKSIKTAGATSYKNGQCGIHVHVSANVLPPRDWWKVVNFIYECQANVKSFCQRAGNYSYCSYLNPEGYGSNIKYMPANPNSRYIALNFSSYGTVEFRMFRGTLDPERFWASLEFAHSMVSFARHHGIAFFERAEKDELWEVYLDHLKTENRYGTILKHFSKRGLTPNKQICIDENTGQTFIAVEPSENNAPVSTVIAGDIFDLELTTEL